MVCVNDCPTDWRVEITGGLDTLHSSTLSPLAHLLPHCWQLGEHDVTEGLRRVLRDAHLDVVRVVQHLHPLVLPAVELGTGDQAGLQASDTAATPSPTPAQLGSVLILRGEWKLTVLKVVDWT